VALKGVQKWGRRGGGNRCGDPLCVRV
jgi:hypothetical protein